MTLLSDKIRVKAIRLFASTNSSLTKSNIEYLFGIQASIYGRCLPETHKMESKADYFRNCLSQFSCDEQVWLLYDFCFVESVFKETEIIEFKTNLQKEYKALIESANQGYYEDLLNGDSLDCNAEILILSMLSYINNNLHTKEGIITIPEETISDVLCFIYDFKLADVVQHCIGVDNCKTVISNRMQISSIGKSVLEKWLGKVKLLDFAIDHSKETIQMKRIESDKIDDIIKSILDACDKLANNSTYTPKTKETSINNYIRDVFVSDRFSIISGTKQGLSGAGIEPGEIDLSIIASKKQVALIECLKLSCVDKGYLSKHILKAIGNYNSLGVPTILLIYYGGKDINFYSKIKGYIKEYIWPDGVEIIGDVQDEIINSAVKKAKVILRKEGYQFEFFFIIVKLLNSSK